MKLDGVKFNVIKSAIREIEARASNLDEGAKGLRTFLEANLMDTILSCPSIDIMSFQTNVKNKNF